MIREIASYFNIFNTQVATLDVGPDQLIERNLKVSKEVEVVSTYHGAINQYQRGSYLDAEASLNVMPGDFLLLVVTSSGGGQDRIPYGYQTLIEAQKGKDLKVSVYYTRYEQGDRPVVRIPKLAKSFSVTLLTLRGVDLIVDAKGLIDTAGGWKGLAFTPRVDTAEDGCLLTFFAYADPLAVTIEKQETLLSFDHGEEGIAVGVSETEGGTSGRIKAEGLAERRGNGTDIAIAIALY